MAVYDISKGNLIIDSNAVTGFAEDSKVTHEYNEDFIEPHTDVDGETTFAITGNRSATVTLHLKSNSPWCSILHRYAAENKVFPISWEDFNDNAVGFSGEEAMVVKPPEILGQQAIEDQDVEIFVGRSIVK